MEIKKVLESEQYLKEPLISRDLVKLADLKEYSKIEYEYAKIGKEDGEFIFYSSHKNIEKIIENGKGIIFDGSVYFRKRKSEINPFYISYTQKKKEIREKRREFLNGALSDAILDEYSFPIARSFLELYQMGTIKKEKITEKLKEMVREDCILELLEAVEGGATKLAS